MNDTRSLTINIWPMSLRLSLMRVDGGASFMVHFHLFKLSFHFGLGMRD